MGKYTELLQRRTESNPSGGPLFFTESDRATTFQPAWIDDLERLGDNSSYLSVAKPQTSWRSGRAASTGRYQEDRRKREGACDSIFLPSAI